MKADTTTRAETSIAARMTALENRVHAVEAQLVRDRRPSPWTREEAARFLSVVALAVQGRVFSAAELLAHGSANAELREALGTLTTRQIGKRLRALSDRDVGGLIVRRIGRDAAGTVWSVSVAHLHADAGFNADRGV